MDARRIDTFHRFVFRWRNVLAGAPLVYAFVSTRFECEHDLVIWGLAAPLAATGWALRAGSTLHNQYGQRCKKTLATTGPCSRVRNPLYLGNLLLLNAGIVASELLWLAPLGVAWSLAVYDMAIRHEERRLLEKYGESYARYRTSVPRWLPRLAGLHRAGWSPCSARPLLLQAHVLLVLLPFAFKECNPFDLWM